MNRIPVLERVQANANHSFALKEEVLPFIQIGWHFHPEFELTLFTKSHGQLVIGDHFGHFEPGDLLLIGPNLPHYMRNDPIYYQGKKELFCRAIVIHFAYDFMGNGFFERPELITLKNVLKMSTNGLKIDGTICNALYPMMEDMLNLSGFERFSMLLNILSIIARSNGHQKLATDGFTMNHSSAKSSRVGDAYAFLFEHYAKDISLSEIAQFMNMSDSSFCKFIKKHTCKTFSQVLNEIRIGHACRLLVHSSKPIGEIAFLCGYANPTYFHKKFREYHNKSPGEFRAAFHVSVTT